MKLTQKKLKEVLHYNSNTGIFIWKIKPCRNKPLGLQAGGKNYYGYTVICINKTIYQASRLAWLYIYGRWPDVCIDHINHKRNDNRLCNLREVSYLNNARNRPLTKRNISGVAGVQWVKRLNRWRAEIRVLGKTIYIGAFKDKFEAICARKSLECKYGFHINHGK